MPRKKPGAFRKMFGQPEPSALLEVPGEEAPGQDGSSSAPDPVSEPSSERSSSEESVPQRPHQAAEPPPSADLPDSAEPPPALSLDDSDDDDAPLPIKLVGSATEPPQPKGLTEALPVLSPSVLARPLPRARRPRGGRGSGPAEKGARLLARVKAGESIDDQPFFDAALPGAKLSGADLSCGQLARVDLSGADLRQVDLRESDLRGADLSSADLRGADLRGCRLELTRLESADLRMANLSALSFATCGSMQGADLRGADLSEVELVAAMSGAKINHHTYAISGWRPEQLVEASLLGLVITDRDRLPPEARLELVGVEEGLLLSFTTALSFQDRFILHGLICAVIGPDRDGQLFELSGNRLLLTSPQRTELTGVAEALSGRMWEREEVTDAEHSLQVQIERTLASPSLRNELSALVDRLSRIELHSRGSAMSWRPVTDPHDALKHLMLKLFIPVELRWWLAVVPDTNTLARRIPGQEASPEEVVDVAIDGLKERGRINNELFTSLIEERPRRASEIRAVAGLWGVSLE